MHWQIEAWKCAEPRKQLNSISGPPVSTSKNGTKTKSSTSTSRPPHAQHKTKHQCGQVFYRREQFAAHLDDYHGRKAAEYVREQCCLRRIGRNGQKGFWCGFCQTVVELKERGLKAWDERFTHIDEQHFKNNERVEDWYPMDKELPKGLLDDGEADDGEEEEKGSDEEFSGSDAEDEGAPAMNGPQGQETMSVSTIQGLGDNSSTRNSTEKPKQKRRVWYCVSGFYLIQQGTYKMDWRTFKIES